MRRIADRSGSEKKTLLIFLMVLLSLSFGCKAGGALHGLGKGLATAAKVATVAAAVAASSPRHGRVSERAEVERSGGSVAARGDCRFLCPVEVDGEVSYVCAAAEVVVDPMTNQARTMMICDEEALAVR